MIIREYQSADCKEIITLFYETVHNVNAKDYTKEQLDVCAADKLERRVQGKIVTQAFVLQNKI